MADSGATVGGTDRADPEEVDKDPVMAIDECPDCGPNSLATVKVENAVYIASCASCDHEVTAPVIEDGDGGHVVAFDRPARTATEDGGEP